MSRLPRNRVTIYSVGPRGIKEEEVLVKLNTPQVGAPP